MIESPYVTWFSSEQSPAYLLVDSTPRSDGARQRADAVIDRGESMVLVIDDEYFVRDAVLDILAFSGYHALGAASGIEGLRLLEEHGSHIRAVLLDMKMPGMNGLETLQRIRQLAPNVYVILCSGVDDRGPALRSGGDPALTFLQKPYSLEELMTQIHAAYARGRT
jgi:DNA-binding NtrC family response regulator